VDPAIVERASNPVFGLDMYQLLHDSQITLNTHIDIALEWASNMRLYEATGVGTCLLTDWQDDLSELFVPDKEVVTYRNANEAVEKANYLLTHDNERRAIAHAGKKRTLAEHTFDKRAIQFDELIQKALKKT
jgi:spore maturation protein CgeB